MGGGRTQFDLELPEGESLATEAKQDDIITAISNGTTTYTVRIAEAGGYTYIGKAVAGSAQSSAVWQVSRIDEASGMILLFADGNTNRDNVWNNYATLTYS